MSYYQVAAPPPALKNWTAFPLRNPPACTGIGGRPRLGPPPPASRGACSGGLPRALRSAPRPSRARRVRAHGAASGGADRRLYRRRLAHQRYSARNPRPAAVRRAEGAPRPLGYRRASRCAGVGGAGPPSALLRFVVLSAPPPRPVRCAARLRPAALAPGRGVGALRALLSPRPGDSTPDGRY